jgi:lipopolysaccharide/colanic/teichoic acid biosynthesis glycosyltransferase
LLYRLRDISLALWLLCLTAWLMLLLLPLLAITQQRVFFVQVRTGKGMKPFRLIKFSTMRDIVPGEREEDNQRARLTPIGRILRALSLDELPQLWNVLRGEMSFVGPRPLLPEYDPLYSETQRRRFEVLPGITGWAQVNGRNAIPFERRFELDVEYVDRKSLGFDLRIMCMTLVQVFRRKGVYATPDTTMPRWRGNVG